jgi:hypothetical protein
MMAKTKAKRAFLSQKTEMGRANARKNACRVKNFCSIKIFTEGLLPDT